MGHEGTLKKRAGQCGSSDSHPFLREERLELRVSAHEKRLIEQSRVDLGFGTLAQYIRAQALARGKARSSTEQHKALMACAYEFNRLGNNLNQIARHLNQGQPFSEEVQLVLLQILDCASELVRDAKGRPGAHP
jgi:hypothetical protein